MQNFRSTKIVATLGPASEDPAVLRELIEAGVDVVRLNFSHGTQEEKGRQIADVRAIEAMSGRPVAVLQDIQGPKIRAGRIPYGPITLKPGTEIRIYADEREGSEGGFSTTYPELGREVGAGDAIFLDDGNIELRVLSAAAEVVLCEVVVGGELSTGKGINLPGASLSAPPVTSKDESDLRFGLGAGVDFVAMSFVRRPEDAEGVRRIMRNQGINVPLLAKIEKREAVERLVPVLRAFDGAMVARGDLGVELRPEMVPGAQKEIIKHSIGLGRPVITATQMLESMTTNRRPTRAEASDVANAVFDGTHAVMLSGETAIGRHPVEVVKTMDRIVREAERIADRPWLLPEGGRSATHAFCAAAAELAEQVGAEALVAFTRSGRTARTLSSLHPRRPIVALCHSASMARQLCLWRGVVPVVVDAGRVDEDAPQRILRELSERRILEKGSRVVAVGASLAGRLGSTDFIRLLRV